MALKTRVFGAGKLVVLAGVLLATYLIFAAAAMRIALKTREVAVPDVVGRSVNEASAMLAQVGLALRIEDGRRSNPKVPMGGVAAQEPAGGLRSRRQRSVKVWLSSGPHQSLVPALVGESERAAELRLQDQALTVAQISEIRSRDYPSGTVIAQEPPARAVADAVALLVNRGERVTSYVMPDLIGTDGERVAEILRARGFRVTFVGAHPYPGVPAGVVLRQRPPAGFQIAPGEPISLEVSR